MAMVEELKRVSKRQAVIRNGLGRELIPELVNYVFHNFGYAATGHPLSVPKYQASLNVAMNNDGLPELYVFIGNDTFVFRYDTDIAAICHRYIPSRKLNKRIRNLRRDSVKIALREQNTEEDKIRKEDIRKEF